MLVYKAFKPIITLSDMNTLSLHGYSNNKGRDPNDRLCLAIFCNTYSSWYSHDEKVQSLMFKYLTANTVDCSTLAQLEFKSEKIISI